MDKLLYMVLGIFCMGFSYAFLRSLINSPEFVKSNYRNASIPSLGGLVVLLSLIISGLVINLLPETQVPKKLDMSTLIIILGFAFIGLLDDLLGDKAKQGFKGHISELFKGRLTTGSLKLFGGPAIVLLSLSNNISSDGYFNIFIDVICISLFANLLNLLDLSPGRTTKFSLLALTPLLVFADVQTYMFVALGVLVVSLIFDIREKYMLGDTGSNLIGALIGIAFVQAFDYRETLWLAIGIFALNVLSEFVSFSKIVQGFYPLRKFEELGQLETRKQWAKERRSS